MTEDTSTPLHDLVLRTFATVEAKDLEKVTFRTCPLWNERIRPARRWANRSTSGVSAMYYYCGKCSETSTDVALKPAHLPRMLNIRDPLSENVAKAADHSERQR